MKWYIGKCVIMDPQRFGMCFDVSTESEDLRSFESKFFESDIPIFRRDGQSNTEGKMVD